MNGELTEIKQIISQKEAQIKEIYEKIRKLKENPKEKMIEELKGIKRTTGQHPGGLLITLPNTDIQKYTPLNYPADNRQAEWMTTHFEYSFLSKTFLKVDILGHDEPTILQKLFKLTGKNPLEISFQDQKVMQVFTEADTLGIPEFGTDFVKRNLLTPLKPTKFSHLLQISGFSHGTDVWTQNQQTIYKNKELALNELIACREDIWNFLVLWGVDKKRAFIATEYIRKKELGWEKLSPDIKAEIKSKLNDREGELYFSILSKIKYIFPKPHAIAYTMTAWRTAFYKVYYPQAFYSTLLTYHGGIYDIWLMTLDADTILFRLENLLNNLNTYKGNEKELFSLIKVLEELNKEKKRIQKIQTVNLPKLEIEKVLLDIQQKINNLKDTRLSQTLRRNGKVWKLTAKEKGLLFTLKVILEMEFKGLGFKRGIDFNQSEVKNFKIENNTIYFPFTAITGIGDKVAEKIMTYRQNQGKITANWKKELAGLLNINHLQQIENLQKYNLLININS
ncbi:MAG: DNA polymerase III, alpha subunit PolC-type [Mycoplasmataceae bacterium RC_NB112A]|nr:MAG: DNA polymerase III, alpha subunit PolC-type [Mycoplasmataceae bacterium RC_NB112A]